MTEARAFLPFACRGGYLSLLQNPADGGLWLSIARSSNRECPRTFLIRVAPTLDHRELPYVCENQPERLTLATCRGRAEFRFDRRRRLRIRLTGISLRLTGGMMLFENATPTEDGGLEIGYLMIGKLLLTPIRGAMHADAAWSPQKSRTEDFRIELAPSAETGVAEAAIAEYYSNGPRDRDFEPFDEIGGDFADFCQRFGPLTGDAQWDAARVIWSNTLGPQGELKREAVYRSRLRDPRAYGWEQAVQAIACAGEPRAAVSLLMNMALDGAGLSAARMDDINCTPSPVQAPLLGAALGLLPDAPMLCEASELCALYDRARGCWAWWHEYRDRARSGLPQAYALSELPECGPALSALEPPLHSPGLTALLALLADGCARLAPPAGSGEEAEAWAGRAVSLAGRCLAQAGRVTAAGGAGCTLGGFDGLLPVLLGRRLPAPMACALAERFSEGMLTESAASDPFRVTEALPLLLAIGFDQAGHPEISRRIARVCRPRHERAFYQGDALHAACYLAMRRW